MNSILTSIDTDILLFVLFQFVNVIISTIKSILTVNGSRMTAAVINAVSYTFYGVVTKMLTEQPFTVIITVTFLTNLIGVYIAKFIMDKARKEKLWIVTATIRSADQTNIEALLRLNHLGYTIIPAHNDRFVFNIFSYSKDQSSSIREILQTVHAPYTIIENKARL